MSKIKDKELNTSAKDNTFFHVLVMEHQKLRHQPLLYIFQKVVAYYVNKLIQDYLQLSNNIRLQTL